MSDEYEAWVEKGTPMPQPFFEWLVEFMPDWECEYSGDVWGLMKAFKAGQQYEEEHNQWKGHP